MLGSRKNRQLRLGKKTELVDRMLGANNVGVAADNERWSGDPADLIRWNVLECAHAFDRLVEHLLEVLRVRSDLQIRGAQLLGHHVKSSRGKAIPERRFRAIAAEQARSQYELVN